MERLPVRERNMNLLLETVIYIAIKERVTCIITIETVICIMHCRKYHLHNCNRDIPICIITIKIATRIFATGTVTCICVAEPSNCIIATETVTCKFDGGGDICNNVEAKFAFPFHLSVSF